MHAGREYFVSVAFWRATLTEKKTLDVSLAGYLKWWTGKQVALGSVLVQVDVKLWQLIINEFYKPCT